MSTRWYVIKVDNEKLEIAKSEKKPVFQPTGRGWPRICNVDGQDGEDAIFAGGFITASMGLNVGIDE